MGALQVNC